MESRPLYKAVNTLPQKGSRLGRLIKATREARGMTQEELSRHMGMDRSYIAQLESGKVQRPTSNTLGLLERHLGLSRMDMAQAMNVIATPAGYDLLADIRHIVMIADIEQQAKELRKLPPEVQQLLRAAALALLRVAIETDTEAPGE